MTFQPLASDVWDLTDPKGALKYIGLMPGHKEDGLVVAITATGVWTCNKTMKWKCHKKIDTDARWGQVTGLCFDKSNRIYIASSKNGLEVFESLDFDSLVGKDSEFRGCINLSLPSLTLVAVDTTKKCPGTLFQMGWTTDSTAWSPSRHSKYPRDFQEVAKTVLLCAARPDCVLHKAPKDILHKILEMTADPLQVFSKRQWHAWSDKISWLGPMNRGDTHCVRRAWYSGTIMLYFVDQGSTEMPEDGVRCVSLGKYAQHTFIEAPFNPGTPWQLEIPHLAHGEVVYVGPMGMAVSGTPIRVSFPKFNGKLKHDWLISCSNADGAANLRSWYCCAYQRETASKNKEWCVILTKALEK